MTISASSRRSGESSGSAVGSKSAATRSNGVKSAGARSAGELGAGFRLSLTDC